MSRCASATEQSPSGAPRRPWDGRVEAKEAYRPATSLRRGNSRGSALLGIIFPGQAFRPRPASVALGVFWICPQGNF